MSCIVIKICLNSCRHSCCAIAETHLPNLFKVPVEYQDLQEVFSKSRVFSLPPHCPYNFATDLLSGAPIPLSCLFNLSLPENDAVEKYSTPLMAGLFFVEKKDKTLRPCFDCWSLSDIKMTSVKPYNRHHFLAQLLNLWKELR